MYVTVPVVHVLTQSSDVHQAVEFLPIGLNGNLSAIPTAVIPIAELNTGPPSGNLVVILHRWIV
jgi:hypothetical protein